MYFQWVRRDLASATGDHAEGSKKGHGYLKTLEKLAKTTLWAILQSASAKHKKVVVVVVVSS